ncbi:MAG: endonuclease III [Bacteroidales bacterium]|nr:endonuclease III [Bacteroidales bacterium]
MKKKDRYKKIIEYFSEHQPHAETELSYSDPYELIVAVILSAQCTDKRVNIISPDFFKTFPEPLVLANASVEEVFEVIKSCSFPNNKAKHLVGMAKTLTSKFNGVVPSDIDDLQKLPGIGRKSANVILSVVFNKPAMAVDTHVFRVSERIGLTTHSKNPLQTEIELVKNIPEEKIAIAHHWLLLHGRYVCTARNPKCFDCGISSICKYFFKK